MLALTTFFKDMLAPLSTASRFYRVVFSLISQSRKSPLTLMTCRVLSWTEPWTICLSLVMPTEPLV